MGFIRSGIGSIVATRLEPSSGRAPSGHGLMNHLGVNGLPWSGEDTAPGPPGSPTRDQRSLIFAGSLKLVASSSKFRMVPVLPGDLVAGMRYR